MSTNEPTPEQLATELRLALLGVGEPKPIVTALGASMQEHIAVNEHYIFRFIPASGSDDYPHPSLFHICTTERTEVYRRGSPFSGHFRSIYFVRALPLSPTTSEAYCHPFRSCDYSSGAHFAALAHLAGF